MPAPRFAPDFVMLDPDWYQARYQVSGRVVGLGGGSNPPKPPVVCVDVEVCCGGTYVTGESPPEILLGLLAGRSEERGDMFTTDRLALDPGAARTLAHQLLAAADLAEKRPARK